MSRPDPGAGDGDGDRRAVAPLLRISGNPSPEELAALVAVLAAGTQGEADPEPRPPASSWAAPERLLRAPVAATGWWASSLPR